jgi:hypothetical protein
MHSIASFVEWYRKTYEFVKYSSAGIGELDEVDVSNSSANTD